MINLSLLASMQVLRVRVERCPSCPPIANSMQVAGSQGDVETTGFQSTEIQLAQVNAAFDQVA